MSTCRTCGAALDGDQRYCVNCGERAGAQRVDWRALLTGAAPAVAPRARPRSLPSQLPGPRVAAALLLVVLGFGVIVGAAVSPDVSPSLASAHPDLTIVMPPATPAPAPAAPPTSEEQPAEPPEAAPAPTPEPTVAPPPAAAPAPKPQQDKPLLPSGGGEQPKLPPVDHVFLVSVGPGTFDALFGPDSKVPYLAHELAEQGTVLSGYEATSKGELANQVTLLSGQPANPQTEAGCPMYTPMTPGDVGDDGTAHGEGCVYSSEVYTLPDQLTAAGHTWKAYVEDQGAPTCRHPADGQPDPWQAPRPGDAYVTWRNPFVYFQTITTTPDCATNDVGLTPLDEDLKKATTTPTLAWIAPSPCHDGRATQCAEGAPAGPEALDAWLRVVVPKILASDAYKRHGLLAIVPDASGADDLRTGALLLSRYVAAGGVLSTKFDHRSLLKSVEDLFALRHLATAEDDEVSAFGTDVYSGFRSSR